MKTHILSWLLHHANRYYKSDFFYRLKSKILNKYGKQVGYDFQFIEGYDCWSCNGTGIFVRYSYYSDKPIQEMCYKCYNGKYHRPHWNLLERIEFGKYTFHKPINRVYEKPDYNTVINGYITHKPSYWSHFARVVLYLIYCRKDYKQFGGWDFGLGDSYRCYWFLHFPKNFINNIVYKVRRFKLPKITKPKQHAIEFEELPF